ncbi:VWA domain-containing protein [candidate division KSB3 bacterium]|uniref:VWA domain-containing protein n=1 Tax=candidate division KSB3 bacterium TaxID=2044937 RepID=A0A9D5Q923_9BACT|nr:VWA domain-containing protein [candidate division KSB3 bacterium]MBD3327451.1 VWA domain-containing protein [candidate division KSB3 bacterium]
MKQAGFLRVCSLVLILALSVGCGKSGPQEFVILSGSENESLEPILHEFGEEHDVTIIMQYKGSVDIMRELSQEGTLPYDAVWPANSLWISLGDRLRRVKHAKSIMISPVVFGIRKSLAQELGFIGQEVRVRDILDAIRQDRLQFMMTSATQSNSGASAYIGFLYALLGHPDILTLADLHSPELRQDIQELFAGIHRSSGSSGWLKDLFLTGNYDAMVNYESMIIEANQELVRKGQEPLYAVYPVDGIVFSDSPLGYIDQGEDDEEKEALFQALQAYLLSDEVQETLSRFGRRTGVGGVMGEVDTTVFNPEWGIDVDRILSPIPLPSAEVIRAALTMYQTEFRKPSLTVFCLDFSGSMKGEGAAQLKQAMELLLDQEQAKEYLINASSHDHTIVIPFNSRPQRGWQTVGNDTQELAALLSQIKALAPGGGTDIYTAAQHGLQLMAEMEQLDTYVPAIILMTDGKSEGSFAGFENTWRRFGLDIPVFGILFGDASAGQLEDLARLTRGRVFDGRHDLVQAFRKAKGYN